MRTSNFFSTKEADAVADAVLVRRLNNAGFALIATWMFVLAFSGWKISFLPTQWVIAAAIVITLAILGFVAWTLISGDLKIWRQAFNEGNDPNESE